MQIPNASVAEIMGRASFDWVAVDLEHGSFSLQILPDIFRALALGGTLPLVRTAEKSKTVCQSVLDAGSGGIVFANVDCPNELENLIDCCRLPPNGTRGVGFSRSNLFGIEFNDYIDSDTHPLMIAMIESLAGVTALEQITEVDGLDAIFIGPYDLSASLGSTGLFNSPKFQDAIGKIKDICSSKKVPLGIHIVQPNPSELRKAINDDYRFIAYSIDAVFLNSSLNIAFSDNFDGIEV